MGRAFVSWYDPKVICEPVWDGTSTPYLLATRDDSPGASMPSSLNDGPSQQHAKTATRGGGQGSAGRGTVWKAAMRS